MQQLQSQKKEIAMQQQALLKKINDNWLHLKDNLKPTNIAKETLSNIMQTKNGDTSYSEEALKHSFTYAIAMLAEKFADKAIEKVKNVFKK